MKKEYNLVELFSGIGSQHRALSNNNVKVNLLGTCEWDIHALVAYNCIHKINILSGEVERLERDELLKILSKYNLSGDGKTPITYKTLKRYSDDVLKIILSSLKNAKNFVDITKVKGKFMPKNIDIMTYSFPCQDLSTVGQIHGYNKGIDKKSGSRSSLLWEVGRILKEMNKNGIELPRFLLMENVRTLLSNRHIENFNSWQKELESLGYYNKYFLLNSKDLGLPQSRTRLIMISVLLPKNNRLATVTKLDRYYLNDENNLRYKKCIDLGLDEKSLKSILKTNYNVKKYFEEALDSQPNNTPSRREIWKKNPILIDKNGDIIEKYVRTLTTKQDRHPNSGNIYFDYENNKKSKYRFLTPRECLLLMGFREEDYENIINANKKLNNEKIFTRDKIVRMAGNSIPVNILQAVFKQIIDIDNSIVI